MTTRMQRKGRYRAIWAIVLPQLVLVLAACTRVGFAPAPDRRDAAMDSPSVDFPVAHTDADLDARALDAARDSTDINSGEPLEEDGPLAETHLIVDTNLDRTRVDLLPADGPAPDTTVDTLAPPLMANAHHDDCAHALVIDLSALGNGTIDFDFDTSGAASDYAVSGCSPFPEVVVALVNVPPTLFLQCVGGSGKLAYGSSDLPQCVAPITTIYNTTCSFSGAAGGTTGGIDYALVLCRDPALGPAKLRIFGSHP